jgi:uncharacterized repeat protein (TIGR01451 family)
MERKIKKIFLAFCLIMGVTMMVAPVSAQSCPYNTTVKGTSVTFVGELTDLGGDSATTAWFEYGKNSSLGTNTSQKTLYQTGIYCITVSNLDSCTTYHYRAVAENSIDISYGEKKTFTTSCNDVEVTLKANGSEYSTTIDHGESANLSWNSENADNCYASVDWSGSKDTSGSQSTGQLTSSKRYTLTCDGPDGSASDSVEVRVGSQVSNEFSIKKTVRNVSRNTDYSDLIYASPGEQLIFGVVIRAGGNSSLSDVDIEDSLPSGLIYKGDLRVNGISVSGSIISGFNLGNIPAGEKKTVTFRVDVASADSFSLGQTQLTNTVSVSSGENSRTDNAKVIVSKSSVAGAATSVSTGLTNNLFFDSFFLPLLATLLIIWFFRSPIVGLEKWLDVKKKGYQDYKSGKNLRLKIAEIRNKELL